MDSVGEGEGGDKTDYMVFTAKHSVLDVEVPFCLRLSSKVIA